MLEDGSEIPNQCCTSCWHVLGSSAERPACEHPLCDSSGKASPHDTLVEIIRQLREIGYEKQTVRKKRLPCSMACFLRAEMIQSSGHCSRVSLVLVHAAATRSLRKPSLFAFHDIICATLVNRIIILLED